MSSSISKWIGVVCAGLAAISAPAFAAAPQSDDFNAALKPFWKQADVGQTDGGSAVTQGGELVATGSGNDIWTTSFQFFYTYQENVTGDFVLTSKVTKTPTPDHGDGWSSTALFVTAPSAIDYDGTAANIPPWVFVGLSNNDGIQIKFGAAGASDGPAIWGGVKPPAWVRLTRKGTLFTGYASLDGKSWAKIGSTDIPQTAAKWSATDPLLAGIAIQNHDGTNLGDGHADDFVAEEFPTGDTTAPAKITDMGAAVVDANNATVSFTPTEVGSAYEVRWSVLPITAANFDQATAVGGIPAVDAGGKITLNVGGLEAVQRYYFAARTSDVSGNVSEISNLATVNTPAITGGINREVFTDIGGGSVTDLENAQKFIDNKPDISDIRATFEAPTDILENYGTRMRGYFTPKTAGDYTFFIASDDHSSLRLSTDDSPDNATEIATVGDWTSPREWTKFPTQHSDPQTLVAGKKYYIEALQKEGGGGDNLAVGISTTFNDTGDPDPPAGPIPNDLISPFAVIASGRIAGVVTDKNGNPIANAAVEVKVGTSTYNLTTSALGYYSTLASPGAATVKATMTPWADNASATATVTADQFTSADLQINAVAPPFKPATPDAAISDNFDAATLNAKWTSEDVEAAAEGGATITNGMLDLTGIGGDMWDGGDHFHYVYQKVSDNDFEAVLHVINTPTTDVWSKVGIDVREVPSDDSGLSVDTLGLHFMAAATNGNGEAMQGRSIVADTDGTDTNINANGGTFINGTGAGQGYWVKVVRQGSLFQAFKSLDGVNYSFIGQQDFSKVKMSDGSDAPAGFTAPEVQIGIAATTHDAAPLETENPVATVDDFIFSGTVGLPTGGGGGGGCLGNVTDDNAVDVQDAVAILRHVVNLGDPLTGQKLTNANVNGDAGVDVQDAVIVLQAIVDIAPGNTIITKLTCGG